MKIDFRGVAKCTIDKLTSAGHTVICGSRHPGSISETECCKPVQFDLHADVSEMTELLCGCDAVYYLAGSHGKDLLQTDAFGAVKLMQAAEKVGIRRFIMLSSIFALEPEKWAQEKSLQNITNYNIAKFFADHYLVNCTDLDYTIVQPSVLKEESGTGMIELDPEHDGSNPIPDVAEVLCEVLTRENTFKKVIKMRSGTVPISTALAKI
ncbi:MAG: SDR family oxidoreductase [Oscillospiraceae bacterium]|nr:SDR family oxidoreductase [Oscillospiraceae bacterium]